MHRVNYKVKSTVAVVLRTAVAFLLFIIFIGPLIWMVLSAFKPGVELLSFPPTLWPRQSRPATLSRRAIGRYLHRVTLGLMRHDCGVTRTSYN